ncbi:MAG: hypothetical protein ACKOEW_00665, partial [Methylocystis sp.]
MSLGAGYFAAKILKNFFYCAGAAGTPLVAETPLAAARKPPTGPTSGVSVVGFAEAFEAPPRAGCAAGRAAGLRSLNSPPLAPFSLASLSSAAVLPCSVFGCLAFACLVFVSLALASVA